MTFFLNHILSFAKVSNIDKHIEKYKNAGFSISDVSVRHDPGKRNRFLYIGTEYLEFCWIEDKKKFNSKADKTEKYLSLHPQPFGLAFESKNLDVFKKKKNKEGFILEPVYSKAPADGNSDDPWWSFLKVPKKYLPGFYTFALSYLKRGWDAPREARVGKNSIFGIAGVTFITKKPKDRARYWTQFLNARPIPMKQSGQQRVQMGPHYLEWVTELVYRNQYNVDVTRRTQMKGWDELVLTHLLAKDLDVAHLMLKKAGFRPKRINDKLFVRANDSDGYAFLITQGDFATWKELREKCGIKIKSM